MKDKRKKELPAEEIPLEEQLTRRQSAPQPTFQDEAQRMMQEQTQYGITEGMKTGVRPRLVRCANAQALHVRRTALC